MRHFFGRRAWTHFPNRSQTRFAAKGGPMSSSVRLACEPAVKEIDLAKILPTRVLDEAIARSPKYQCTEASIRELGLIEPLVVYPESSIEGSFILLDGHVRLAILKALGKATAKCLVAKDDEGFTYNHKVNRLTAIQEHFMILRAIKNGVAEERIARSLNIDVQSIRQKRDLLEGICSEAVLLLREKRANAEALRELRKVKPMRQIEIAELMCAANNFSVAYSKCLVTTTQVEHLVDPERGKEARGLSPEDVSRMEHELESLGRDFKLIEETHGKNTLQLVIVVAYLKKLLDNSRVVRHLANHHPEILAEFQKLVEARNLGDGGQG
ncbi:MAG: plasmid partitioning protein RepB C-terminal domain-containing protein [Gemmataceae bacterium]